MQGKKAVGRMSSLTRKATAVAVPVEATQKGGVLDVIARSAVQSAEVVATRYASVIAKADGVVIQSEGDRIGWSAFHAELTEAWKVVDAERKEAAAPWDRVTKAINAAYRTTLDALDAAKVTVGKRLSAYIAEERVRQERELESQRERERLAARAAEESGQQIVVRPKEAPAPIAAAVRTSSGTTASRETWDCEVLSLDQIPREFLVFDKQLVLAKCRAMEKSVGAPREDAFPGLRVFKTLSVASTQRRF